MRRANQLEKLTKILEVFRNYDHNDFELGAEHDVLYLGCSSEKISMDDRVKLEQLDVLLDEETQSFFIFV
jgi:hypothetical protein